MIKAALDDWAGPSGPCWPFPRRRTSHWRQPAVCGSTSAGARLQAPLLLDLPVLNSLAPW